MKKKISLVLSLALCLTFGLGGCKKDKDNLDTSILTGAEVVSEDGTVSILLPDDSFTNTVTSGAAMIFESEDGGYIYVEKGETENAADYLPQTEDELLSQMEGIDAEIEIKDFVYEEDKDGVKNASYKIYVTDFVAEEGADPEDFVVLQDLTVDGNVFYTTYGQVSDEALVEKMAVSLATFGDAAES